MEKLKSSAKVKILLTSFQTWLPHQKSNSSDDLLEISQKSNYVAVADLFFLRNLPVNIEQASHKVIKEVEHIQPEVVICCGMAEKRTKLTIESNASCANECLYTTVNLTDLVKTLKLTEVSHDAGKFVCEGLYYQLLKYIRTQRLSTYCIFVHVPLLSSNQAQQLIKQDFESIIDQLACMLDANQEN
ncbi:MAG: peptidase C15 [Cyanobacteria bacterium P01_C01_bin.72]